MRRRIGVLRNTLALLCLAFPLAACAPMVGGEVVIRTRPPAPRVEVIGVAPGPDYVWIQGHWAWHDNDYGWIGGRWEQRPDRHARWVAGRWQHRHGGWSWTEGHWSDGSRIARERHRD